MSKDNGEFKFERERVFQIDVESSVDGERYHGTFTCKRLGLAETAQVGVLKTRLNGGYHCNPDTGGGVDPGIDLINEMIAMCEVSIVNSPKWWTPREMDDLDVLHAVYQEIGKFPTFRQWKADQAGRSAEGAEGRSEAGSGDDAAEVVDLQVPATAD